MTEIIETHDIVSVHKGNNSVLNISLIYGGLIFYLEMKDVMAVPNPNDKVVSGLQSTSSKPIPLKNVCVRAKMMDLAAQVITFNLQNVSVRAKMLDFHVAALAS